MTLKIVILIGLMVEFFSSYFLAFRNAPCDVLLHTVMFPRVTVTLSLRDFPLSLT